MYSENSLNTKKVAKTFQILQLQQKSGYVIAELTSLINALRLNRHTDLKLPCLSTLAL